MKHFIIVLLLFTSYVEKNFSQTDTLIISDEADTIKEDKYNRVYKLFIEDQDREARRLWKLNLMEFQLLGPNFGYEQRIGKSYTADIYLNMDGIDHQDNYGYTFGVSGEIMFKYYHNFKRRERLGKKTNGFSGNYLAIGGVSSYSNEPNVQQETGETVYDRFSYGGKAIYGIQRRIGNVGYIEGFAGVQYWEQKILDIPTGSIYPDHFYKNSYITFLVGVRAGFAIDSFKNLKKMLKK